MSALADSDALKGGEINIESGHSHGSVALNTDSTLEPLETDRIPSPRTKLRLAAILTALYVGDGTESLNQTIMATSIPTISSELHSASGYVWIGGAYLLANAATGPVWAKCSDIWGRKPAILGAVALFAAASIIAALSVSMKMLVAARALQGTAGGGLLQLVFITISDLFSMRERVLYLGLTEVFWAIAGGAGPLIGGAFTQLVTWRWCYWINVPICAGTFVLLLCFLDVHNPRTKITHGLAAIDWLGTASLMAVIIEVLLGLDFGGTVFPWSSATVICLIVFGVILIGAFLLCEKKLAKYPLMPLGMFDNRANIAAVVVGIAQAMCYISAEYYLPLFFQSVKEASPIRSGILILPVTISEAALGIITAVIMHQTGRYREVMWAGAFLVTLGTGLYISFDADTSVAQLVGFMLIGGSGCGFLFEAPIISLQNTVSQADTATATATFGLLRNVATSVSIVIGGVVFQNGIDSQAGKLRAAGLSESLLYALSGSQAAANVDVIKIIADATQRRVVKQAFASSIRGMWIMYTCIAVIGLAAAPFCKQQHMSEEHTETRTGIEEMTKREGP
ncbi:hypothetical protein LTR62_007427 [Meristemomyces frigidus]|uniref:Major facilitator superfamily (MFS) profile domain-containing protein n=1 Tax=Meristemomyces frigidus TaxID=1508187 RepID=A0AAN7THJ6_9PEZI|nr:hypothetical protein LTR62_007427 [Meristemomyces frigidus]